MIIMKKRPVKDILKQIVTQYLNEWLLRALVLVSLLSQIELVLLGNRRKYTPGKLLSFILWQAYTPRDAIVDIFIGVLFNSQGDDEDNSSQQNNMIQAFWLPFLLQHLGGPDTIKAYSLEDNELWKRQSLGLIMKSAGALIIFFRSWKGIRLKFLAIPMLVTGLIKYWEKTWFLRSGSKDHLRNSMIRPGPGLPDEGTTDEETTDGETTDGETTDEDEGPSCACGCNRPCYAAVMAEYDGLMSYAAFMAGCDCKRAEGYCVSCHPESDKSEVVNTPSPDPRNKSIPKPSPDPRKKSIPVAAPLQKANEFLPKFERLFTDLVLEPTDLEKSKSFFKKISWKQAFEVIEIELGFVYDIFYTKPMEAYDKCSFVRHSISLFSEISAFIGFLIIDRHEYSTIDVIITWLLLVGATVLEIYSIILLCSSDRTMNWLNKQEKTRVTDICEALSSWRLPVLFPANKRWSDSMAQYSLISYSLKKLPIEFSEVWKFFCISQMLEEFSEVWDIFCICPKLEDCSSENSNVVPEYLKSLIFEHLLDKSKNADIKEGKELCAHRGQWTLENMKCFSTLHWSIEGEFDESVLLWHLATDLCYYTDLNKNSSPVKNLHCKASKLLSDYMVYLLVKRPLMLPDGIGQIRFQDSCAEATEIFQSGKHVKDRIQACKKLLLLDTEIRPLEVKADESMSVIFDACVLAKSLQSLETKEKWECEKKWKMISHVWVEMLCYAGCHCPWDQHAKGLTQGGELLTHVWLLMAHFGITQHFRVPKDKGMVRRVMKKEC